MPKERAGREKKPRGKLQCQYPGGCSNERAFKRNGERHWLCGSHRDHQNALQRERYKKVKKVPKQNSSQTPKKKTARKLRPATLKRSQNKVQSVAVVARGDDVELLRDANARELHRNDERRWEAEDDHPLNVGAEQTAVAVTSPSPAPVSRSSGATSDSRAEEPLSTLGGDSVDAANVPTPSHVSALTCAGTTATTPAQPPQVVYVFLQATPIVFGGHTQFHPPQQASLNACGPAAADCVSTPSPISLQVLPGMATQGQPFCSQAIGGAYRATSAFDAAPNFTVGVPRGVWEAGCTGNTCPHHEGASTREDGSSDNRQPSLGLVQEL